MIQIPLWFQWLAVAFVCLSLWKAGDGKAYGWLFANITPALWVVFGLVTHQYVLIVAPALVMGVYLRNWHVNRKEQGASTVEEAAEPSLNP